MSDDIISIARRYITSPMLKIDIAALIRAHGDVMSEASDDAPPSTMPSPTSSECSACHGIACYYADENDEESSCKSCHGGKK